MAVALACALLLAAPAIGANPARAAAKAAASKSESVKKPAMRQFTGWVTALDKTSITVEKRGKTPQSVTFAKHAEMSTTGDLEKDARVTVYYRDDGGRKTAHKVVVKPASTSAKNER
jgi:hypothetical protein